MIPPRPAAAISPRAGERALDAARALWRLAESDAERGRAVELYVRAAEAAYLLGDESYAPSNERFPSLRRSSGDEAFEREAQRRALDVHLHDAAHHCRSAPRTAP